MRRDNLDDSELKLILRRLDALEKASPVGSTSITRGQLRVASTEGLLVEGTAEVSGELNITGVETVDGTLHITGTLDVDGPADIAGTLNVHGTTTIAGATTISGATTLGTTLTVNSAGKIVAGNITIDALGTTSGRIISGQLYLRGTTGGVYVDSGLTATGNGAIQGTLSVGGMLSANGGLSTTGSKLFIMVHPTKPDMYLRHGATESPVSGVEYWGDTELDDFGRALVELPDYFEALTKPDGRTALVTGRGFSPDWSDIEDGAFTVTGRPGGRFSWLVKAERFGADFETESTES